MLNKFITKKRLNSKTVRALPVAALLLGVSALSPLAKAAPSRSSTGQLNPGTVNTFILYTAAAQDTSCTLEATDGQMAYYAEDNGPASYISSARRNDLGPTVTEVGDNPRSPGRLIAYATAPKNTWQVKFFQPTLTPDNSDARALRLKIGGAVVQNWTTAPSVTRNMNVPPNQRTNFAVDVRFKKNNGFYPKSVYNAQVDVECLAKP